MDISLLAGSSTTLHGAWRAIGRAFPRPQMLFPKAVGVDISDASIKWIVLRETKEEKVVEAFGEEPLQAGIVVGGVIQNQEALSISLRHMKDKLGGIECAHAALPEETAYVFSMHIPSLTKRSQIHSLIEFELEGRVPIPPSAAVFDFDVITHHEDTQEIGVEVFPRELAESYAKAFSSADLRLLSLEVEASSVGRAVSKKGKEEPITLLVDFGRSRTGFAVLKHGIPIFTSTVAVGGDGIDKTLMQKLSIPEHDLIHYKNEEGLFPAKGPKSPEAEAIAGAAAALADEVTKHFHYWDTRRNEHGERVTPVERVYLVGGSSNLKGLDDYISSRVQAPCERPNVWQNVCSFDEYIPPINARDALQYATAIGLALRSF